MNKVSTIRTIPTHPTVPVRVKVAAYARVSDATGRQPSSLSAQVSHYSRLIQSTPGWEYAGVFTDLGITGTSIKRPGFQALMDTARDGGIDIILCKSISRLARNTVDLLATIRELKTLGVAVRFERENIDTTTTDGELLLTLLASFAQEESRSLSENVKWSIQRRFAKGIPNSTLIYGYRWIDEQFVIEPAEAEAIRLAYKWFIEEGVSAETITNRLNSAGYRSRFGKAIEPNLIRRVLENERYTGNQMLQKTFIPTIGTKREACNTGQLPRYWVENSHPAIIDQNTFNAVQAEIKRRREGGKGAIPTLNTGCFTSRIRCATCGCSYQRKTRAHKMGTKYKFWRCWNACRGKGNPCGSHNLRETMLKTLITTILDLDKFNEQAVIEQVEIIQAYPDRLTIHLTDGQSTTVILDEKGHIA